MLLTKLKIGEKAKIIAVNGEGVLRHRLLEMGILPRTNVELVKMAPLGDPLEIRIRGYELSIRKEEGNLIEVEKIKEEGKA